MIHPERNNYLLLDYDSVYQDYLSLLKINSGSQDPTVGGPVSGRSRGRASEEPRGAGSNICIYIYIYIFVFYLYIFILKNHHMIKGTCHYVEI